MVWLWDVAEGGEFGGVPYTRDRRGEERNERRGEDRRKGERR